MPTIQLTDTTTLDVTVSVHEADATLNRYLKDVLRFKAPLNLKAIVDRPLTEVNAATFPISLSAAGGASFAVANTVLSVKPGVCAKLGFLVQDDKNDFVQGLQLPADFASAGLISFALDGSMTVTDAAATGDFSFGVTSGSHVTLTSFYAARAGDTLLGALQSALAGLTIPHELEDLKRMPANSVCRLQGKTCLQFQAGVTYALFSNPLASIAVPSLPAIAVNAGAEISLTAEASHTGTHTLTIAKLSNDLLHIAIALENENDWESGLTVSAGVTAGVGDFDALALLMGKLLPASEDSTKLLRQELPDKAKELSADIKDAIDRATLSGLQATLSADVTVDRDRQRLFLFAVKPGALDETSGAVFARALRGDFSGLTQPGAVLAGITELDSALAVTTTQAHSLGVHLLGIYNYQTTHEFLKSAEVDYTSDQREIVFSDKRTEVKTGALDKDKLREIVLKDVTLTLPAGANTPEAKTSLKILFFDREGSVEESKLRRFRAALQAVGSAEVAAADAVLQRRPYGACSLYLSMTLNAADCRRLFLDAAGAARDWTFFLSEMRAAEMTLLRDDAESADRLKLFGRADAAFWQALQGAGARPQVVSILKDNGFADARLVDALVTDVFTSLWWSQAMGGYAKALHAGSSLVDAGKAVVKDSTLGFNEPWLVLATWNILGKPAIESRFRSSGAPARQAAVSSAAR